MLSRGNWRSPLYRSSGSHCGAYDDGQRCCSRATSISHRPRPPPATPTLDLDDAGCAFQVKHEQPLRVTPDTGRRTVPQDVFDVVRDLDPGRAVLKLEDGVGPIALASADHPRLDGVHT